MRSSRSGSRCVCTAWRGFVYLSLTLCSWQAKCLTHGLRWGPDGAGEIRSLQELLQVSGCPNAESTALIVGSDVIYAREVVPLLFWTVDRLLAKADGGLFLMCSSFSYDEETEAEIDAQCAKFHFERRIIDCSLSTQGTRIQSFTRTQ